MTDDITPQDTSPEDGVSAHASSASNTTEVASVRVASVGGLVRAKAKMIGAWSVNQFGSKPRSANEGEDKTERKDPKDA